MFICWWYRVRSTLQPSWKKSYSPRLGRARKWGDLNAVEFALQSSLPPIKSTYIKWFSDSSTACKIIQVSSMKPDLHKIALQVLQICIGNKIDLDMKWAPRTELERGDFISRSIIYFLLSMANTAILKAKRSTI